MSIQNILNWITNSLDKIYLGITQASNSIGNFSLASLIVSVPYTLVTQPAKTVAYPFLRKKVTSNSEICFHYKKSIVILFYTVLPLSTFAILNGKVLFLLIFGVQWTKAADLVPFIAIYNTLGTFVTLNLEVYKSIGRESVPTKIMISRSLVGIIVYFFAATIGIKALVLSRVLLAFIFSPINIFCLLRITNISLKQFFNLLKNCLLYCIIFSTINLSINYFVVESNLSLFICAIIFLIFYFSLINKFVLPAISKK